MEIVPVTVLREIDGVLGSFSILLEVSKKELLKTQEISVLDYLIKNADRISRDMLTRPGGDIIAVDHGVTFGLLSFNDAKLPWVLDKTPSYIRPAIEALTEEQVREAIEDLLLKGYDYSKIHATAPAIRIQHKETYVSTGMRRIEKTPETLIETENKASL